MGKNVKPSAKTLMALRTGIPVALSTKSKAPKARRSIVSLILTGLIFIHDLSMGKTPGYNRQAVFDFIRIYMDDTSHIGQ